VVFPCNNRLTISMVDCILRTGRCHENGDRQMRQSIYNITIAGVNSRNDVSFDTEYDLHDIQQCISPLLDVRRRR